MAFQLETLQPIKRTKKRVGRPRFNWTATALELYWILVKHRPENQQYINEEINMRNINHINIIKNSLNASYLPKPEKWPSDAWDFMPSH